MKEKSYQNFGSGGSSDSPKKLAELGLPDDMTGQCILDLGCNAGFFCIEAAKRGASLAVGIEARPDFFEAAKENAAKAGVTDQCRFLLGDWNDLVPSLGEKFDFVLWLAAMHYEKRPKRMAHRLRWKMKPRGKIILDVGVMNTANDHSDWHKLSRPGATDAYPSNKMLHHVFSEFSLRYHSSSKSLPNQGERFIYHGSPRLPIVILIGGETGAGKTVFADMLTASAVRISGDTLLSRLDSEKVSTTEFGQCLDIFHQQSGSLLKHQKRLVNFLIETNKGRGLLQLAELLCHPVNPDSDFFVIEGGILGIPAFQDAVRTVLGSGYIIWKADRLK